MRDEHVICRYLQPTQPEFQAGYTQLARSTSANVSVMILQGCKSTPQKSRPIESGHLRHAVQVANVCSYKLGLKSEFQF